MNQPKLVLSLLLATAATMLPAQQWTEVGDAGQSLANAQVPTTSGPLLSIVGQVGVDADLYLIEVPNPTAFSATTVGSPIDTQLWLFDERGVGVAANDDFLGQPQARLDHALVKAPGRYYLAITAFNHDPASAAGGIWGFGTTTGIVAPNGPGRLEPLSSWSGVVSSGGGNYTITLTGALCASRHVVLPDSHHLSEHPEQATGDGSLDWWRTGGGHFQILYEGSNFLSSGVSGSIDIERLLFRAEDGTAHPGGVTFPVLYVTVAKTSLTTASMSNNFANNLAAPATTTLWGDFMQAEVHPSLGTVPNNYNLVLDIAPSYPSLQFQPAGAQPNLLVDIRISGAAHYPNGPIAMVPMQDTTGSASLIRGIGLTSNDAQSATGTMSGAPPVMGVDIDGYGPLRMPMPARTEYYGAACGGAPASFYQAFVNGQLFDLRGLRMTPDNAAMPTTYTVTSQDIAPDLSKLDPQPDSTADDATVAHALGFTLRTPGYNTTGLRVSTNGFVWLDGFATDFDFSPSIGDLLAAPSAAARLAPFWNDLHCGRNVTTHANSGLHVRTDTSAGAGNAVCYVTWLHVGAYQTTTAGSLTHTFQVVMHEASGVIEYRYGTMPRSCTISSATNGFAVITGFAPFRGAASVLVDPQSRDLSLEGSFTTSVEGTFGNMGLDSVSSPVTAGAAYGARMFPGQTVKWNVYNVPPGSLLGVQLLDTESSRPGAYVPTVLAPGCVLSTSQFAILHEIDLLPGSSVTGSVGVTVPANPNFAGAKIYAQYVVLGGLFGAADLITVASNSLEHTIGRR